MQTRRNPSQKCRAALLGAAPAAEDEEALGMEEEVEEWIGGMDSWARLPRAPCVFVEKAEAEGEGMGIPPAAAAPARRGFLRLAGGP